MRKLYFPIIAGLLLVVLTISVGIETVANTLLLYVRVARLYAQDPPTRIAMPLQDVPKKQIANTWHASRGGNRLHEGQDIFALRGTPVYSASQGYIYNIGENNLGGQTVSVAGAGGRFYYYAHLDSYAPRIQEGDYVTPKTLLGYVGTTGNAQGTPPHLHFGVYTPTGAINPLPLLIDRTKPENRDAKPGVKNRKSKVVSAKPVRLSNLNVWNHTHFSSSLCRKRFLAGYCLARFLGSPDESSFWRLQNQPY